MHLYHLGKEKILSLFKVAFSILLSNKNKILFRKMQPQHFKRREGSRRTLFLESRSPTSKSKLSAHKSGSKNIDATPANESAFAQRLKEEDTPEYKVRAILLDDDRTDHDAIYLSQYFQDLAFFDRFRNSTTDDKDNEALLYLFKSISYERIKAGTVIFKEGEYSNGKIYILMNGELAVVTKKLDVFVTENLNNLAQNGHNQNIASLTELPDNEESPNSNKKQDKGKRNTLTEINDQGQGKGQTTTEDSAAIKELIMRHIQLKEEKERKKRESTEQEETSIMVPIMAGMFQNKLKNRVKVKKQQQEAAKKDVILWDPNKIQRLTEDQVKVIISRYGSLKDRAYKGSYFGEKALFPYQRRNATIFSVTDCELLIITSDVFHYVKKRFDVYTLSVMNFFKSTFPNIDHIYSTAIIDGFLYILEELTFERGTCITKEGHYGDKFYLIYQGCCSIRKKVIFDDTDQLGRSLADLKGLYRYGKEKGEIHIADILSGSFFGEEILFTSNQKYEYTVRVESTEAKIFALSKMKFILRFPREVYTGLKDLFQRKKENYYNIMEERLRVQHIEIQDSQPLILHSKDRRKYSPSTHLSPVELFDDRQNSLNLNNKTVSQSMKTLNLLSSIKKMSTSGPSSPDLLNGLISPIPQDQIKHPDRQQNRSCGVVSLSSPKKKRFFTYKPVTGTRYKRVSSQRTIDKIDFNRCNVKSTEELFKDFPFFENRMKDLNDDVRNDIGNFKLDFGEDNFTNEQRMYFRKRRLGLLKIDKTPSRIGSPDSSEIVLNIRQSVSKKRQRDKQLIGSILSSLDNSIIERKSSVYAVEPSVQTSTKVPTKESSLERESISRASLNSRHLSERKLKRIIKIQEKVARPYRPVTSNSHYKERSTIKHISMELNFLSGVDNLTFIKSPNKVLKK